MRIAGKIAAILGLAGFLTGAEASAQERSRADATNAAGWTVIGLGTALGAGSITSGTVLLVTDPTSSEEAVGVATLAGGVVTIVVSLVIGIPLVNAKGSKKKSKKDEAVQQVISGRFSF